MATDLRARNRAIKQRQAAWWAQHGYVGYNPRHSYRVGGALLQSQDTYRAELVEFSHRVQQLMAHGIPPTTAARIAFSQGVL